MTDEIHLDGKNYVSSKRASELSGYAQDYIGQLARAGNIDAQRVGGLWYIFLDSLISYKEQSDREKPTPPTSNFKQDPDTLVFFDGKQFISANRASQVTSYSQDYVGQLARSGKILSRQIGNRWYVDREGIVAHKKEKDALLAAVQAESVGIHQPKTSADDVPVYEEKSLSELHYTYSTETGHLMPPVPGRSIPETRNEEHVVLPSNSELVDPEERHAIPIRIVANDAQIAAAASPKSEWVSPQSEMYGGKVEAPRKTIFFKTFAVGLVTLFFLVSTGIFVMRDSPLTGLEVTDTAPTSLLAGVSSTLEGLMTRLEHWLVPEIIYLRGN